MTPRKICVRKIVYNESICSKNHVVNRGAAAYIPGTTSKAPRYIFRMVKIELLRDANSEIVGQKTTKAEVALATVKTSRIIRMFKMSLRPWIRVANGMFAASENWGSLSTRTQRQ